MGKILKISTLVMGVLFAQNSFALDCGKHRTVQVGFDKKSLLCFNQNTKEYYSKSSVTNKKDWTSPASLDPAKAIDGLVDFKKSTWRSGGALSDNEADIFRAKAKRHVIDNLSPGVNYLSDFDEKKIEEDAKKADEVLAIGDAVVRVGGNTKCEWLKTNESDVSLKVGEVNCSGNKKCRRAMKCSIEAGGKSFSFDSVAECQTDPRKKGTLGIGKKDKGADAGADCHNPDANLCAKNFLSGLEGKKGMHLPGYKTPGSSSAQ